MWMQSSGGIMCKEKILFTTEAIYDLIPFLSVLNWYSLAIAVTNSLLFISLISAYIIVKNLSAIEK